LRGLTRPGCGPLRACLDDQNDLGEWDEPAYIRRRQPEFHRLRVHRDRHSPQEMEGLSSRALLYPNTYPLAVSNLGYQLS
jgi:hypothetical protein